VRKVVVQDLPDEEMSLLITIAGQAHFALETPAQVVPRHLSPRVTSDWHECGGRVVQQHDSETCKMMTSPAGVGRRGMRAQRKLHQLRLHPGASEHLRSPPACDEGELTAGVSVEPSARADPLGQELLSRAMGVKAARPLRCAGRASVAGIPQVLVASAGASVCGVASV